MIISCKRVLCAGLMLPLLMVGCASSRPPHVDRAVEKTSPAPQPPKRPGKNRLSSHNPAETRYWFYNMVVLHRFSRDELAAKTGLNDEGMDYYLDQFDMSFDDRLVRPDNARVLIAPYPGGRHPRIGFREGAIDPIRGTKVSIFTPWDPDSYVVYDVPEAIWSHLGLTYLAHKHIATIWDDQGIQLRHPEWTRNPDGTLEMENRLPNGIEFGTKVTPGRGIVFVDFWIGNDTDKALTDLRVQMCLMLSRAEGFNQLSNENKVLTDPYVACKSPDGNRWIITAFTHCSRPWANEKVPCIHSDPKLPDCPSGGGVRARGIVAFYEGTDIEAEFLRLESTGWRDIPEP